METTMGTGAETIQLLEWIANAAQRYPWWIPLGFLSGGGFWLAWKQYEARCQHERELETERLRARLALEKDWLAAALRAAEDEEAASFVRIARAMGLNKPSHTPERQTNPRVSGGGKRDTRGRVHVSDLGVEDAPKTVADRDSAGGDAGEHARGANGRDAPTGAKRTKDR